MQDLCASQKEATEVWDASKVKETDGERIQKGCYLKSQGLQVSPVPLTF